MMTPVQFSESSDQKLPIPGYSGVTIEQLFLFLEVFEAGSQIEVCKRYEDLSRTKLSKSISDLRRDLHLSHLSDKEFWQSEEAFALVGNFKPLKELFERFVKCDQRRIVSIGAGGSLLGWLVGKKCNEIRKLCSSATTEEQTVFSNTRLSCRPYSNRDILQQVMNGSLDFGFVRASLLDHARAANGSNPSIISKEIGEVHYGIAIPYGMQKSWGEKGDKSTDFSIEDGYLKHEESILNSGLFVSVGPEGEFKAKLERALIDNFIDLKVEFNYTSFPQILPHIIEGTHFGLCPIFRWWHGLEEPNQDSYPLDDIRRFEEIPGARIYPLKLLAGYKREIVMIWHKDIEVRKPWVKVNEIAALLQSRWIDGKSYNGTH